LHPATPTNLRKSSLIGEHESFPSPVKENQVASLSKSLILSHLTLSCILGFEPWIEMGVNTSLSILGFDIPIMELVVLTISCGEESTVHQENTGYGGGQLSAHWLQEHKRHVI